MLPVFVVILSVLFCRPVIFLFRLSIYASRIGININRTGINISQTGININGGWININMTSKYINAVRIYITTIVIYIIVTTININRVGGIMNLLAIFKNGGLLSSFLGEFYSFDLSELWTGRSKYRLNVFLYFAGDVKKTCVCAVDCCIS